MDTPRSPIGSTLMPLVVLPAITGCALTPHTVSNVDPGVDFSQYQTFGFFDPLATDQDGYESLVSSYL